MGQTNVSIRVDEDVKKEAETLFKKVNITCSQITDNNTLNAALPYPSIILETDKIKITASIENIIKDILQEKRAELVEALVGQEFAGEE